ncbi:T9SS type A sorting domain-containing protein [Flavivirga aquimarina]|uniref:T9SS type A sorting domain-containing protein n=1 Tax=Flavivirga aquimarina TaxID=2027862 RepID=A0ABT8W6B3_9FLAO|nr:T9SS type A sorting domain-containing protein [Flavivirga aquimarina]MDO5968646.1 T9SS type A sorting domain-containing protein [Flavivirga aquimarina]
MKKNLLLMLAFLLVLRICAQDEPFNCDYNAYLFQYNDVYAIDLASGNSYEVATDVTEGSINAAAYNPADGYIWGSLSYPSKSIVRIGKDFSTLIFYVDELPTSGRYIGDVSSQGVYYLKGGGQTYYTVDVNPDSENYGGHIATKNLPLSLSIHDWAFNAVDGKLYTVEKKTNILYRIDTDTDTIENLGEVPILSGLNYTYGAVYFDASGRFYVSANQTGTIYVIQNVQDLDGTNAMDSNLFAFGPSSSQNDGARCPTAPVPQEDCINGIDDDGDGLVDCEDPSCSGYASCPVIEVPTSSGNEGGLESNNRLSELINKRNFNRAKNNYKFDKTSAKRLVKSAKYGKKTGKEELQLSDFVPVEIIGEDYVIESSPTDLLNITNATEIYSVDYMKSDNAISTIMVLKTDEGVYEHTKYICDRLLGAELLSVSTIEIKEHSFIKALIRNIDGSVEFVLSLSAKPVNGDNNFDIESHWNLDKYESNVPYYNFQIWSNSLDDLLLLGEEVVRLLDIQKPVSNYNSSAPPTVFVKKGKYRYGKLELQIINTNKSEAVNFEGGLRATETNAIENISSTLSLDGSYITNVEVDAGSLFDIGFRIGDGIQTPDDLFMSDGSWGYDDAGESTIVSSYIVEPNEAQFSDNEYPIERNIELVATTSDYIATYRSLTPKFSPIDFSDYKSLQLKGKGTGTLIIRLVKEGVSNWEEQYKTSIVLADKLQDYSIPFTEFTSINGGDFEVDDITSIVFTMLAENGEEETKAMTLQQLRFSTSNESTAENLNSEGAFNDPVAIPNPMKSSTKVNFTVQEAETVTLLVYNQLGGLVKQVDFEAEKGNNQIQLDKNNLVTGLYFCKISNGQTGYKTIKLLVE